MKGLTNLQELRKQIEGIENIETHAGHIREVSLAMLDQMGRDQRRIQVMETLFKDLVGEERYRKYLVMMGEEEKSTLFNEPMPQETGAD
ncbi:MAG: hypothetical protein AAGM67_08505 [Bacteroidota bacterium]